MRCRFYDICEHKDFMSESCMGFGNKQSCKYWMKLHEKRHGKRKKIFSDFDFVK